MKRTRASIEDNVHVSIQWLEDYTEKHDEGVITSIRNETDYMMDNKMKINRESKWEEKQLCERFKRLINNISNEETWTWLKKKETLRENHNLSKFFNRNTS